MESGLSCGRTTPRVSGRGRTPRVGVAIPESPSLLCRWMYSSDVTITGVSEVKAGRLVALAVFSEQTLGKFLAKFSGDHVTLTPCHDYNISMRNSATISSQ